MNALSSRWGRLTRLVVVAAIALAIGGAWGAGRTSAQASQGVSGARVAEYDIGAAGKPTPTGTVRAFQLVAKEAAWEIAPGVSVPSFTYNGQVPGPTIRVTEEDTLRVTLTNALPQATSIHWHGLHVPNGVDGVPPFTQPGIAPGQTFTDEFPASHAGTFINHSHLSAVEQIDRGLYGTPIIDPATPPPARFDKEFTMLLSAWDTNALSGQDGGMGGMSMNYNSFTINGKACPANATWTVRAGDLVRVRIINSSNVVHPMHQHGQDFTVVAKDGEPIRPEQQQTMNTIAVNAGATYDIVFRADNPGTWVFHCHELHHTENDGVEPGGLIQVRTYAGGASPAPSVAPVATPRPAPATMPSTMPGMGH